MKKPWNRRRRYWRLSLEDKKEKKMVRRVEEARW
jgi:hypothetical protein